MPRIEIFSRLLEAVRIYESVDDKNLFKLSSKNLQKKIIRYLKG